LNKRLSILVVDDHETMRKVTSGQLASIGHNKVDMASNGSEALGLLDRNRYDIVISDWNMPNTTGIQLLRAMRASPKDANTPFIMITAETERSRIEEAIACGVSDLLVKPYTAGRLATSIDKALTRRRVPIVSTISPPAANQTVKNTSAPDAIPKPGKATLLLVDDTADNLHLLANIFGEIYRIRADHTGAKALDICCSDMPPDLVLLDVMMPSMDGFEVARRMREHPAAENVPIIFVTSLNDEASRLKGMELGAVDFITKPIDPTQLKLQVDNFMRHVELRRKLQADYDNMLAMARLRDDVETMTRHDLKGPLAGAIGIVQSLMESRDIERRQADQLLIVEQALMQVINMVNLSIELYKIETDRFVLKPEPLAIDDMLRRVVATARGAYTGKQLTIAVEADVEVGADPACALGDAMLTYSLLNNLIKNACEAAPERSRVDAVLIDSDPLRIEFTNRGAIPPTIRDNFFDKFVSHGKEGGTGLGNYSAKLLANAQQGDVSFVVSDDEDTTTLIVTLPTNKTR